MSDTNKLYIRKRRFDSGSDDPYRDFEQWAVGFLAETGSSGRRIMSPVTEERLRNMISECRGARAETDDNPTIIERELLTNWKDTILQRVEDDKRYAEARVRVKEVQRNAWLLRYCDYHAMALSSLREAALAMKKTAAREAKDAAKAAEREACRTKAKAEGMERAREVQQERQAAGEHENAQPLSKNASKRLAKQKRRVEAKRKDNVETPTEEAEEEKRDEPLNAGADTRVDPLSPEEKALRDFLGQPWYSISQTLKNEQALPDRPMTALVLRLSYQIGTIHYLELVAAIDLYAQRNNVAHSNIGELARDGDTMRLANRIVSDLRDLRTETIITAEERAATRAAILRATGRFFKTFNWNERKCRLVGFEAWPQDEEGRFIRPKQDKTVKVNGLAGTVLDDTANGAYE